MLKNIVTNFPRVVIISLFIITLTITTSPITGLATTVNFSDKIEAHAYFRIAIMRLQTQIVGTGSVLLLGDSIIEGFWWNTVCGKHINGGIASAGILIFQKFLDDILHATRPKIVTLMIGVNDSQRIMDPIDFEKWCMDYDEIVSKIVGWGALPVLFTIIPVEKDKPLGDIYFDTERIKAQNAHIRRLAGEKNYILFDSYNLLAGEDGFMLKGGTIDGVHPSKTTYVRLYSFYQKAIKKAWGRIGKPCPGISR
jgi:lysophospholipase L1-like esterase